MNRLLFSLVCVLLSLISERAECQVVVDTLSCSYSNLVTHRHNVVITYRITNNSDTDYLTWVTREPIKDRSDRTLLYDFYKTGWLFNMYDQVFDFHPELLLTLGLSLIKKIKLGEHFEYIIIKDADIPNIYDDRIVIVKENVTVHKIDDASSFKPSVLVLTQ